MHQPSLLPFDSQRAADIDHIHLATAIYTAPPEVEALLDQLDWPACGGRLLDPGAGDGVILSAALARLDLPADHIAATDRVRGYEFHPGAAQSARAAVSSHLRQRGWTSGPAAAAAERIVEQRDFLLSPLVVGSCQVIAMNPPFLRRVGLPAAYRAAFDQATPAHAQADLLFAYLQKAADLLPVDGAIGLIASDRFLLNQNSAALRARLGQRFRVRSLRRLDAASAFYRPKLRRAGTPPRIQPVSMVLDPHGRGLPLTRAPFALEATTPIDGVPLANLARIQLAPWLGPAGIFVIADRDQLPEADLVPAVGPDDIHPHQDELGPIRRWAIRTAPDRPPAASVLTHLERELPRMPSRGRRKTRWLPPESFAHRLPLAVDAVLVPRIARRLRAIPLPAGTLPLDHGLVVASGLPPATFQAWFSDPRIAAQAEALAPRLENSFFSYTATLLRQLIVPLDLLPPDALRASR